MGESFQIAFYSKQKLLFGDLKINGSVVPFSRPIAIGSFVTHSIVDPSSPNPLCFNQEYMYFLRSVLIAFDCAVPATLDRYSFELIN